MDGIEPEQSGDLESADLPRQDRSAFRSAVPSKRDPQHLVDGNRLSNPSASLENSLQSSISDPIANWQLVANFQLPGENAAYALIDGQGRFVEFASGQNDIWGADSSRLIGQALSSVILDSYDRLHAWLLDLRPDHGANVFSATLSLPNAQPCAVQFKRLPLFFSPDSSQSRIALKIAPDPERSHLPVQSRKLSSRHELDGRFLLVNTGWTACLGHAESEFLEATLETFVHPDDRSSLERMLAALNAIGGPCRELLRFQAKDSSERSLLVRGERSFDGKSLQFSAKDISLDPENPANELLGVSLELVNESVVLLERDKSEYFICFANRAFEEDTGYRTSEIVGKSISSIEASSEDDLKSSQIEAALEADLALTIELNIASQRDAPIATRARFSPLRDRKGQTRFYAAIFENVTREKAAANALELKNLELSQALQTLEETQQTVIQQESLRALGQMASGIAHDFNNLLAPILGFSELLLSMPAEARDNEKLESFLRKIQVAAQDGAAVVSRLREFYRAHNPEEGGNTLIEPKALLEQVKDLTKHRWKTQAEAKGINIRFRMDFHTHRCLRGNEPELRQSLANLIINAVDAIQEDGEILIAVDDQMDRLLIRVSDTGIGMSKDLQAKCLDPFYTTKGQLGTGLGLSIVSGIVKRHGGDFTIDSTEGAGTTITMSFPSVEAHSEPGEGQPTTSPCDSVLRILLVDDEEVLLEVVSELLQASGHIVDTFSDPESAVKAIKEANYDLIITDRAMPRMSGDQLAASAKAIDSGLPIYLMTGFGDVIKESGENPPNIDGVLVKPVPLEALNRKLSELIASKKR
ncbi:MAG: hypothetical protein CBD18_05025 [Opitutales bacterium TMED158]|nr:MAG: hypothetical protein CBD18_05025 [Opitutales bacterium TMED158]